MAGLYKERTGIYFINWYDENGKKRCQSTRTKNLHLAKQIKVKLEYDLSINQSITPDNRSITTILDEYINQLATHTTRKHWRTQQIRLIQLINHQNIHTLRDITPTQIDAYLAQRKYIVTDTTIRHDYVALRAFLRWCQSRGYVQQCVTDRVIPPKINRKLPKILNTDEVTKLFNFLTSDQYNIPYKIVPIKYIIFVELFTGLRFSRELLRLRKKDIVMFCDDNGNNYCEIYVHETKSGKAKIVPVNIALYELLKPLLDTKKDDDLLFPVSVFPRTQWQRFVIG